MKCPSASIIVMRYLILSGVRHGAGLDDSMRRILAFESVTLGSILTEASGLYRSRE